MGSNLILILLACMQVGYVVGQGKDIPQFRDVSALENRFLLENFTLGATIGTIDAFDPDGTTVSYFLLGDGGEYFQIGRTSGVVTLKKLLEFDTQAEDREIITTVRVQDEDQQTNTYTLKVFVQDVNDVPPEFDRYDIFETISEDAKPGMVVARISVTDEDTTNEILSVTCLGESDLFADACDKFGIKFIPGDISNKNWVGNLTLDKSLDYEQRISFAILLVAKDGAFETTNEVHIEVKDINDSPPIWTRVLPVTIPEEHIIGDRITTVTARDGDVTDPRDIFYEIIPTLYSDGVEFSINNVTGDITNVNRLDYDERNHQKGKPYEIRVKAREVISTNPMVIGNDASTTSTTVVSITISDIDDNTPTFNEQKYNAIIPENIVDGGNIPGLQMTITDIDSGTLNSFDLVSLDFQDIFSIIPAKGQANAGATLFIKNSKLIDYELGSREYVLRLEARENAVIPALTGSATVTVKVEDINDQTPVFKNDGGAATITRRIDETVAEGYPIIDLNAEDSEAGNFGTAGIRYKLFGNQLNHFQIDAVTGVLSVAKCSLPGEPGLFPCIDYERKKQYVLTVSAADDLGNGRTRSIQIIVLVNDINDNVPKPKTRYTASIYEEQTSPVLPLIVKAEDPDTVGKDITYSLVGDPDIIKNWRIENKLDAENERIGEIFAATPAKFSWAQDPIFGTVDFKVQSADSKDTVLSDVTIFIIDINNNAPIFSETIYEVSIKEDTRGDVKVYTVTASDGDAPTTGNGILDFTIASGGLGKFTVKSSRRIGNNYIAEIFTNPDATFNYDQENKYTVSLVARDQGSPTTKRGSAKLIVNIIDINNNDPQITPTSVSKTVAEDRPKNALVHTVKAIDPDNTADLRYYMTATRAQNPSGANIDKNKYDYTQLFRIEEDTGKVRVNQGLNRELTSFIVFQLTVIDVAATPQQTGTGALFITITEVNDQDPQFDLPFYNITIDEELNINFFVRNLHCTDEDDQISRYMLRQTAPRSSTDFFTLMDNTGSLIIADRIDYEKLESIQLIATCFDDGTPQRFGTADVTITIRNVNDNSPKFNRPLYTSVIDETMEGKDAGGTVITTVFATDIDKGDFGIVRYRMANPADPFEIDNELGIITVKPGTIFDRERAASVSFQVVAYDSPNTPDKRRETSVPVYLTINDLNDNCPIFNERSYSGSIPESANTGTDVIDTLATDTDYGINRQIVYSVQAGSFEPTEGELYFGIDPKSGRVRTETILTGKFGVYSFNVTATDTNGNIPSIMCSTNVPAKVTVDQSQNYAPHWRDPPKRDWVIYILESQYEGMLVYDAHADDPDPGLSGVVDYFFVEGNAHVPATDEFRINKVTGIIRAEIEFDREQQDRYFLTLVAVDQGATTASSETTLIVVIMDVDDNDPIFETRNGVVIPLSLPNFDLLESTTIPQSGRFVGKCKATDADSDHENNRIYYEILSEDENLRNIVDVNRDTCEITLLRTLDFEVTPKLEFNIYAFNKKSDDSVKRNKRAVNPSILPVTITVKDVNDNPPAFSKSTYFACAPLTSPYRSSIIDLDAHDVEQDDLELEYSITDTTQFTITTQGIVQNKISFPSVAFPSETERVFKFTAQVSDGDNKATAEVDVFITSPSVQIMMTVNRPSTDVKRVQGEYEEHIKEAIPDAKFVCADVQNHITEDGSVSPDQSDVYMSVITFSSLKNKYLFMTQSKVYDMLKADRSKYGAKYSAFFITDISTVEEDKFGLDEDVVLAILIVTIILIVLALILMALACYCIWAKTKKKKKRVKAQRYTHRQAGDAGGKEESFSNPVYNNQGYQSSYEDEYSTVAKARKDMGPINPVIIPAPENLQPLSSFAPTNLEPADDDNPTPPEIPEPVIETEVMGEEETTHASHVQYSGLEYEDVIETTVQDDEPDFPAPPALDADEIETEIRADTPPPSPRE